MKDAGCGQTVGSNLRDPLPCQSVLLTTPPKRAPPEIGDMVSERPECPTIRGHRVVCEEAGDHCLQPAPLFGNGVVHAATQLLLDLPQPRSHPITPSLTLKLEGPAPRLAAD